MYSIGCDPEFFIIDGGGTYRSASKYIKGTKHDPLWLECGSGLQYDNVALEFASPVSTQLEDFINKLGRTFQHIYEFLDSIGDLSLACVPSAYFPFEELVSDEAKEFGCSPDYNAWTLSMNEPPSLALGENFRSCGAHVHVGVQDERYSFLYDPMGKVNTTKAMDICLALPSLLLDTSKEARERRTLYGKAGAHRPKQYGVEYRTLSNFWLKSPVYTELVYHLVRDALELIKANKLEDTLSLLGGGERIQAIINTSSPLPADMEAVLYGLLHEESRHLLNRAVGYTPKTIKQEWSI